MMFDPPDYPYKELNETLKDQYGADTLLFSSDAEINNNEPIKTLITPVKPTNYNVENAVFYNSNDSGRYFNGATLLSIPENVEQNTEFFVVPQENYLNYEPTLLDENTVNQFLLPTKDSTDGDKALNANGPDLLAIHSCVICHDIFTSDTDLLDHAISAHASTSIENECQDASVNSTTTTEVPANSDSNGFDFDAEWLICRICERVLSTALEVEPTEQLCCNDGSGKGSVCTRKLHTMYVCDFCNGLFADGDSLDRHKESCYCREQANYYGDPVSTNLTNLDIANSPCPETCLPYDSYDKPYSPKGQTADSTVTFQKSAPRDRRAFNPNSSSKMWNCGSCNQLFATARELYRHKRGEDRPTGAPLLAYICEECDKVLGSMCALHTHKKMHKVSKPGYPCQVCGRRFNQSGHLAIHMRMHTGERPYPCDLCPKAFKVKVERDDHRRTHTGERPFACSACPKTFTAAARLREHARIHTDQRPYRCDICGAAFRRPYARTVHTLIHTGEKPHECDVCGTAFRRSGDMWKHKRTLHGIQPAAEETKRKRRR